MATLFLWIELHRNTIYLIKQRCPKRTSSKGGAWNEKSMTSYYGKRSSNCISNYYINGAKKGISFANALSILKQILQAKPRCFQFTYLNFFALEFLFISTMNSTLFNSTIIFACSINDQSFLFVCTISALKDHNFPDFLGNRIFI